jgi:predicted nucleic acid-binding protein
VRIIMDSDSLIKLTKVGAKETVSRYIDIYIPKKVVQESVTIPKKEGFLDAFIIEENLRKGLLTIVEAKKEEIVERMIDKLRIKGGEADTIRLYRKEQFDAISSDDSKFLDLLESLNIPYVTPTAILVYLFRKNKISKKEVKKYLDKLKDMVSSDEYYLSLSAMRGE